MYDTIVNLIKDNNIQEFDENNYNSKTNFLRFCLYKMFYNISKYNLQSYSSNKTLYDIFEGKRYSYDYPATDYDINDLPICYNDVLSLYTLYYIIGISIKQMSGLTTELQKRGIYINDRIPRDFYSLIEKIIQSHNINIQSIDGFNFNYMSSQLKYIINKKYDTKFGKRKKK